MMSKKILIIAEAGVNHNGDIKTAKKLIDMAVKAGADIVKFQTFNTNKIVTKNLVRAKYQIKLKDNNKQFDMLKKLELSKANHLRLISYCNKKNIEFLSTAFDEESFDFLISLGLKRIKVPSGEITNLPFLRHIAKFNKNVIVSTGMCTMQEVRDALKILIKYGTKKNKITLLHCTSEYPAPIKEINLNAMLTIKKELKTKVGYSDHSLGIEVSIAAAALGATIIEKHITMDKNFSGPDHSSSINFEELKLMVKSIRNIELALGDGNKKPSKSEIKNINIVRKFIVANNDIKKGEVFTYNNLTSKRCGKGISPFKLDKLIGVKSPYNFKKNSIIKIK